MIAEVFGVVAPVLFGAALGFGWARFGPAFNTELLASLVLVVGTPCLIFSTLTKFSVDLHAVGTMALAALMSIVIISAVGGAILFATRQPVGTFLPSLLFPNSGNMGLPLCLFAFGDEGLALGIAFFTVTSVGNFTLGAWLASGGKSPVRLLRTPLIWGRADRGGVSGRWDQAAPLVVQYDTIDRRLHDSGDSDRSGSRPGQIASG